MSGMSLQNLSKSFANDKAISDISFAVANGEILVLLGRRGSGKSAILKMIAGLDMPTSGQVMLDGQDITFLAASQRNVGMMFQENALYPPLNVGENIAFPLRSQNLPKRQTDERVEDIALRLGLNEKLKLPIIDLSQSDQQRVALARAMIKRPKALLIDQPLGEVDAYQRKQLRLELNAQLAELRTTTIYVTDEPQEAMSIADQIAIVSEGRLEQIGTPNDIYDHPLSLSIARTIGTPTMNFLSFHSQLKQGRKTVRLSGATIAVPELLQTPPAPDLILGVWPEDISFDQTSKLRGRVVSSQFHGSWQIVDLETNHGPIKARLPSEQTFQQGDSHGLTFRNDRLTIFDRHSGAAIRSTSHKKATDG